MILRTVRTLVIGLGVLLPLAASLAVAGMVERSQGVHAMAITLTPTATVVLPTATAVPPTPRPPTATPLPTPTATPIRPAFSGGPMGGTGPTATPLPVLIPGTGNGPVGETASLAQDFRFLAPGMPGEGGWVALLAARLREGRPDESLAVRLWIPALGLDTQVRPAHINGVEWNIEGLGREVAWLEGSSLPGDGGNTALAGHISLRDRGDGPFRSLQQLAPGDRIVLYTPGGVYVYSVREQFVVIPHDIQVLSPDGLPQLTLVTCTEWNDAAQAYLLRRVVQADLLAVLPASD